MPRFSTRLPLVICALSAFAWVISAPAYAAPKKRVSVTYSSKAAAVPAKTSRPTVVRAGAGKLFTSRKHASNARKAVAHKRAIAVIAETGELSLQSASALVVDLNDDRTVYAKNMTQVVPIASITKLMTAMVVLDAGLQLDDVIVVDNADLDVVKNTHSRLSVGTALTRRNMLHLALMSSENRAAAALGRAYPGGNLAFISAMNRKATDLGMVQTRFVDTTGLSRDNVSTAADLVKMVKGAYQYQLIREFTTSSAAEVETVTGRHVQFRNSNGLVQNPTWDIGLSKTGFINEAGRCLVMQAKIAARPVVIILLDSLTKYQRMGDAMRIKKWMETDNGREGIWKVS